ARRSRNSCLLKASERKSSFQKVSTSQSKVCSIRRCAIFDLYLSRPHKSVWNRCQRNARAGGRHLNTAFTSAGLLQCPTTVARMTPSTSPHPASVAARPAPSVVLPSWARQTWLIARKDLLIELRTGEIVVTGGFFGVLLTVISSLAYYTGPE